MTSLNSTVSAKVNKLLIGCWLLVFLLAVWPGEKIREEAVSQSFADDDRQTAPITADLPVVQEFVPQYDTLAAVSFVLNRSGEGDGGTVVFRLFDQDIRLLAERAIPDGELTDGGYTEVRVDLPVREGNLYYFRLETEGYSGGEPTLSYRSRTGCGPEENGRLFYGGTLPEDGSAVTRYEYRRPIGAAQILTYDAFAVLCAMALCVLAERLSGRGGRLLTAALGLVPLAGAAWFLLFQNRLGAGGADRAVYAAGLAVAGALWCCFAAFYGDTLYASGLRLLRREYRRSHLRTLMFAGLCLLGMYYFNSGSNHGHRMALRMQLFCFAAVFLTYEAPGIRRRMAGKRSLLWGGASLAAAAAAGAYRFVSADPRPALGQAAAESAALAPVLFLWGGLLLRFLLEEARRVKAGGRWGGALYRPYLALVLGFFALLVLFGRGNGWTFFVAVPFALFYLRGLSRRQWNGLLKEFADGALVSFGVILAFSLLFRPYHKFFAPRYPMAFYSVATCSLYLTVVFLAAFFRLADGFQRRRGWRAQLGDWAVMGTVACYTVMTLSRTAFLALACAGVAILICACGSGQRAGARRLAEAACAAACAALVLFPAVFTMTRTLPAVVGHPYVMGGELWEETITSTDRMDSDKYMDIERFWNMTAEKFFAAARGGMTVARLPRRLGDTAMLPPAVLVAHGVTPETWYNESSGDASNGRLAIYAAYLKRLNLTGHDAMGLDTETMHYPHAHNTFLQTAYDQGIAAGVYLLLLTGLSLLRGIRCGAKDGAGSGVWSIFPAAVTAAFGAAGLTEWVFHPGILPGFAFLLVQGALLFPLPHRDK